MCAVLLTAVAGAPVTVVPDLKLGSTQINLAPVQALPEMLLDTGTVYSNVVGVITAPL